MAVEPADVAETHAGVIFFVGDRAFKLKKPVNLGFLDFSTRERRQRACHREVQLNRRFSPDVYLGVVARRPRPAPPPADVPRLSRRKGDRTR